MTREEILNSLRDTAHNVAVFKTWALSEEECAKYCDSSYTFGFMCGALWQKGDLWKSADGRELPEYEREVVAFTQDFPNDAGIMRIAIAHRPDPKGWDGKSITTGEVEHYTPKTYGKGGWNIPDVKFWLDYDINELLCRENETDN